MAFVLVALAAGLALGLATGGRLANLGRRPVRGWLLLAAGVAADLAGGHVSGVAAVVVTLIGYGFVMAFALANLGLTGMGLVVVGLALNALVMSVDVGMPVRGPAVVAAGLGTPAQVARLAHPDPGLQVMNGSHHLAGLGDYLTALSDTIPLPFFGEVASFGDLILAVGLADVAFNLTRPRRHPAHARRRHLPLRPEGQPSPR
jgi:hypothetical protein